MEQDTKPPIDFESVAEPSEETFRETLNLPKRPYWIELIRKYLFIFYLKTGLYEFLNVQERMLICHVGYASGHVSLIDERYAEDHQLKPLKGLTLWMMQPVIELEKAMRQDAFRQACIDVLGEDPNDW